MRRAFPLQLPAHHRAFHLASKRDWDALKRDIKPLYTAVNATAAGAALDGVYLTNGVSGGHGQ